VSIVLACQAIPFAGLRSSPRLGGRHGCRSGPYRQTQAMPWASGRMAFGAHRGKSIAQWVIRVEQGGRLRL